MADGFIEETETKLHQKLERARRSGKIRIDSLCCYYNSERKYLQQYLNVLAILFLAFMFGRVKKAKRKLSDKNKEIEDSKRIIEEKQKDILDSIRYAKRIQTSLLPSDKYIDKILAGTRELSDLDN